MALPKNENSMANRIEKIKRNIELHPIWMALGLVVVGVAGAFGALEFIDSHIEEQVLLRLKPQMIDFLATEPEQVRLSHERQEAADAVAAARRSEQQATEKFRLATEQSDRAGRVAEDLLARVSDLKAVSDVSTVGNKIDEALAKPEFREAVIQRVLPSGAVVAFNVSQGCPGGWKQLDIASGRMIVGAGPNNNLDKNGNTLSSYGIGSYGGEENHVLTIDEMPSHTHQLYRTQGMEGDGHFPDWTVMGDQVRQIVADTLPSGGGKPHNLMPPYVALFFCTKL